VPIDLVVVRVVSLTVAKGWLVNTSVLFLWPPVVVKMTGGFL
jgi:hypothetical protein